MSADLNEGTFAMERLLRRGVEEGAFSGAQGCVATLDKVLFKHACGRTSVFLQTAQQVTDETLFDLASLTKILATTAAILRLVDLGEMGLTDKIARFWPAFCAKGKEDVTVEMLLRHTSGLPSFKPLFLQVFESPLFAPILSATETDPRERTSAIAFGKAVILKALEETPLAMKRHQKAVYSDLGFMVLGHLVERVTTMALDTFLREEIHQRLSMSSTFGFRPLNAPSAAHQPTIAFTGTLRPREPAPGQEGMWSSPSVEESVPGRVDDDNAFAMGGVAGHAGMFGSASDVAHFGQMVLEEFRGAHRLGSVELWERFIARSDSFPESTRALGFDTPSSENSSAGKVMAQSKRVIGHLGFTGTSLWIDLDRELCVALLSNRTHPKRGNEAIRQIRPAFADLATGLICP